LEGEKKGVAGEKGSLGRVEMLKTETLKRRIARLTPRTGGRVRFHCGFH
jgi:hypothetical protein